MTDRPSYRTSKRQIWMTFTFAWLVIFIIVVAGVSGKKEAVDLASVIVPSLVLLIAAMLGIHRYTGSLDFQAAQERAAEEQAETSSYDARDQPGGVS